MKNHFIFKFQICCRSKKIFTLNFCDGKKGFGSWKKVWPAIDYKLAFLMGDMYKVAHAGNNFMSKNVGLSIEVMAFFILSTFTWS